MWPSLNNKTTIPEPRHCLPGRAVPLELPGTHYVNGRTLAGPYPDGAERALFAMGCFWGAERLFWSKPGVLVTAVGYAGGTSLNPLYEEVCSGKTGHAEAVLVVFDPKQVEYARLLAAFWESHNPTQGMRQGHDIGTQYRSAIFATSAEQQNIADGMRAFYQKKLTAAGFGTITTTISGEVPFYFAENDHQQYLAKNPNGYCGLGGTGVTCPLA
ncbi:MAG TPA: peptide-methionine (S)-S-oxide reductase MsrA [Rhodospirillaceae bacterium]|nr:peptide-methionine (S)-S-oxide reductase MsrA [Rhodospirillaceae bacterium]